MAIRISNPKVQRFSKDSPYAPLAGGKMYFYEPGQTVTLKNTFSDSAGLIANTNPVILDANGFEPDIFGDGSYNVVLDSSLDVQQWTRDPVNFETAGGGFIDWSASTTYDAGGDNIVTGSDGKYYVSIQGSNLNQNPAAGASPTFWTEFQLLKQYNANETYDTDDPVTYSGNYYISLTSSNTGNIPSSSPSNWRRSGNNVSIQKFTADGTWTKPAGVIYAIVECIGGGGGGGGVDSTLSETGGGGGGGGYARIVLTSLASSVAVTVGEGGSGGAAGNNAGSAGETTQFGSLCVATAGAAGGVPGTDTSALGGIGTTGDMLSAGDAGLPDQDGTGDVADRAAGGGSSSFGAGGKSAEVSANGADGRNFGGGGAGGFNDASSADNRSGGDGADGFVIVTEYF